jgi:8-oxo-dGTP diphosphatase
MKFQFSAGGIVYKKDPDLKILVSQHSQHHGWVFPKGLIGDKDENKNQTKEETAIREVKEETGAQGEIEKTLTPVTYWYFWEGEKIKKTVYYFIMKFVGGDITVHDHEMEDVQWIDPSEAEKRLSYPGDRKVWKEAAALLNVKV